MAEPRERQMTTMTKTTTPQSTLPYFNVIWWRRFRRHRCHLSTLSYQNGASSDLLVNSDEKSSWISVWRVFEHFKRNRYRFFFMKKCQFRMIICANECAIESAFTPFCGTHTICGYRFYFVVDDGIMSTTTRSQAFYLWIWRWWNHFKPHISSRANLSKKKTKNAIRNLCCVTRRVMEIPQQMFIIIVIITRRFNFSLCGVLLRIFARIRRSQNCNFVVSYFSRVDDNSTRCHHICLMLPIYACILHTHTYVFLWRQRPMTDVHFRQNVILCQAWHRNFVHDDFNVCNGKEEEKNENENH